MHQDAMTAGEPNIVSDLQTIYCSLFKHQRQRAQATYMPVKSMNICMLIIQNLKKNTIKDKMTVITVIRFSALISYSCIL